MALMCTLGRPWQPYVWDGCVYVAVGMWWHQRSWCFLFRKEKEREKRNNDKTNQVYMFSSTPFCSPHRSVSCHMFIPNVCRLRSLFLRPSALRSPASLTYFWPCLRLSLSVSLTSLAIFIPSPTELTSGSYWQSEQPFSHKRLSWLRVRVWETVCCLYACARQSMADHGKYKHSFIKRLHKTNKDIMHAFISSPINKQYLKSSLEC